MAQTAPRTCRCGHTKNHPMIIPEREYSLWGWVQLSILGLTPRPTAVVFRCGLCRESLGVTRDPKVLSGEVRVDPVKKGQPPSGEDVPGGVKNAEH
jgi:hypothetical protein